MNDKEKADKLRAAAGILEDLDGFGEYAEVLKASAKKLDPRYPDGTIAWVSNRHGEMILAVRFAGLWRRGVEQVAVGCDADVTKVEPLRVLADDEIAVAVVTKDVRDVRNTAKTIDASLGRGTPAAAVLRAYADALDAESGGQS